MRMASDTKRQNIGNKVPIALPTSGPPTQQVANMVSLETALSTAIGARVRITTAAPTPSTFEGTLHSADPVTNLVAINTSITQSSAATTTPSALPSGSYRILPISQLITFQILSLPTPSPSPTTNSTTNASALPPLDIPALRARESASIRKLQQLESRRGPTGTTKEAQDIFDGISRTHPVSWDGSAMLVNHSVLIEKPYHAENCKLVEGSGKGGREGLERIRKVLEMERKKLELKGARFGDVASVGAKGSARKGG